MVHFKCKKTLSSLQREFRSDLNFKFCCRLAERMQRDYGQNSCPDHSTRGSVVIISYLPNLIIDTSGCCCSAFKRVLDPLVGNHLSN